MDKTYIKVSGEWKCLYRAVRRAGHTIDLHGVPEKITIDKSGANTAATVGMRADCGADIEMCQLKCGNRGISTIWSGKTTTSSNASCHRYSGSCRSVVLAPSSRASRPCT